MDKKLLQWAKRLQSLAQSGLEYSKDKYDIERFQEIRDISVEILSTYTELDHAKVKSLFAIEEGYQTPKIDVRAVIFKEDKILMVQESYDRKWSLPGGWADIEYSLSENIIKEAKEEAGVEVLPKKIIAILDRNKHVDDLYPYSIYKIFVECDYISGSYEKNIETIDSKFFSLNNLPELSVGRNTKNQIIMCFNAHEKENSSVIFD